jgi:hypothetical protein
MLLRAAGWLWTSSLALGPSNLPAQAEERRDVAVQMRHVDFHIDSSIVLQVDYLRGALQPTSLEHSPYFDDERSFDVSIDSARIRITPRALADLLNHYTFAYPGSPLHRLSLSIEKGQLRQRGSMEGVSFDMRGELTLTPSGELRLHPSSIKAAGVRVGGLMKFLGLRLDKLIKLRSGRGVRIEKDDFFLSPSELLPPPSVKGQLSRVEVNDSEIVQVFKPPAAAEVRELPVPVPKATNYMYYRGNTLRFGKLTMHDTDLLILDASPADPFDFFLKEYKAQLVAGYSRTRPNQGLTVVMQDYSNTPPLPASPPTKSPHRRSDH